VQERVEPTVIVLGAEVIAHRLATTPRTKMAVIARGRTRDDNTGERVVVQAEEPSCEPGILKLGPGIRF